jgi:hypothetical protein
MNTLATSIFANVSPDMIEASRRDLLASLASRATYELDSNGGEKTVRQIERLHDRATKLDSLTLAFAPATGLDWDQHVNSHRRAGDRFNVYAIPKLWETMRVLNGSAFDQSGNDGATLSGTIAALARGIVNEKLIANALNDYMNVLRGRDSGNPYTSGGTQASSSLRALEALGIVKRTGRDGNCQTWGIANVERFNVLAGIAPEEAPAEEAPAVTLEALAAELEGEAPAPEATPAKRARKARKSDAAPADAGE